MFRRNHRDHDQGRDHFDKVNVHVRSVVCYFYCGPATKFKNIAGIFTIVNFVLIKLSLD